MWNEDGYRLVSVKRPLLYKDTTKSLFSGPVTSDLWGMD